MKDICSACLDAWFDEGVPQAVQMVEAVMAANGWTPADLDPDEGVDDLAVKVLETWDFSTLIPQLNHSCTGGTCRCKCK